jgi:hypothetical protein
MWAYALVSFLLSYVGGRILVPCGLVSECRIGRWCLLRYRLCRQADTSASEESVAAILRTVFHPEDVPRGGRCLDFTLLLWIFSLIFYTNPNSLRIWWSSKRACAHKRGSPIPHTSPTQCANALCVTEFGVRHHHRHYHDYFIIIYQFSQNTTKTLCPK